MRRDGYGTLQERRVCGTEGGSGRGKIACMCTRTDCRDFKSDRTLIGRAAKRGTNCNFCCVVKARETPCQSSERGAAFDVADE